MILISVDFKLNFTVSTLPIVKSSEKNKLTCTV